MTAPTVPTLAPEEVVIGTANGPGLWIAPEGTEAPEDFGEYGSPWKSLGYASDDGVTIGGDTTTEQITPWQSTLPIRTLITERTKTLNFTMWQLNQETLGLYFDAPEPTTGTDGSIDMELRTDAPQRIHAIGIDSADAERTFRIAFTRASLSAAGDMQLTRGAAVPLDVTLSALDDGGVLGYVKLGPRDSAARIAARAKASGSAKTAA